MELMHNLYIIESQYIDSSYLTFIIRLYEMVYALQRGGSSIESIGSIFPLVRLKKKHLNFIQLMKYNFDSKYINVKNK